MMFLWCSSSAEMLVGAFFYIFDHFINKNVLQV